MKRFFGRMEKHVHATAVAVVMLMQYNSCESVETSGTTYCANFGQCASGGPFGVAGGGQVIY